MKRLPDYKDYNIYKIVVNYNNGDLIVYNDCSNLTVLDGIVRFKIDTRWKLIPLCNTYQVDYEIIGNNKQEI